RDAIGPRRDEGERGQHDRAGDEETDAQRRHGRTESRPHGRSLRTALVFLFASYATGYATTGTGSGVDLWLVHTNDFHGHLRPFEVVTRAGERRLVGGAAYVAQEIESLRTKHPGE